MSGLRGLLRRLRGRPRADDRAHRPGRAHLVFEDGSVVEAELDAPAQARLEYLARRAVAPPPPGE
jgi:hypothetical protein